MHQTAVRTVGEGPSRLHPQAGFSLLELILVLFLIGVLAVIALVRWSPGGMNVDAAADQVAADLRFAQTLAMTRAESVSVSFGGGGYTLSTGAFADGLSTRSFSGVTVSASADLTYLYPFGAPDPDVTVTLTDGARTRTIQVIPDTGFVEPTS